MVIFTILGGVVAPSEPFPESVVKDKSVNKKNMLTNAQSWV